MPTCVGMTMWKRPLRDVEHLFPRRILALSSAACRTTTRRARAVRNGCWRGNLLLRLVIDW
jgi:hypothetical protein